MSELKPCAHCGGVAEMLAKRSALYHVACKTFGCIKQGALWGEEEAAAEAWNRRPAEDTLRARIAEHRQVLEYIIASGPTDYAKIKELCETELKRLA